MPDNPTLNPIDANEPAFAPKPWEQRAGPGMGGGSATPADELAKLGQATLEVPSWERQSLIER